MTFWLQFLFSSFLTFETPNGSYFEAIPATDSTSYIKWGNQKIERVTTNAYANWPIIERLSIKAENDDYLLLKYWTGSDVWVLLVLPLHETLKEKEYWNDVAIDLQNEIVVYEYGAQDTILIAENIRSLKRQFIGSGWIPCSSTFPHYCMEEIEVVDKTLYLNWTIPNKLDERAARGKKKVHLTI